MRPEASPPLATVLLVRAAQRGEPEAHDQLARRLWPWMLRIAGTLLGLPPSRPEVEDLVATTYNDLLAGMMRFEEREGHTFRDWIARLLRNNLLDEERQRGARKRGAGRVRVFRDEFPSTVSTVGKAAAEPGPEAFALALELHERIEQAIARLPSRQRDVMTLLLAGANREEIARILGITRVLTLNVMIHRARSSLQRVLGLGAKKELRRARPRSVR